MNSFVYDVPGGRVVFGAGSVAEVPNEIEALGARTVMIIASGTSRHLADFVSDQLGDRFVARIDRVNPMFRSKMSSEPESRSPRPPRPL